jgi:hypothetical protein
MMTVRRLPHVNCFSHGVAVSQTPTVVLSPMVDLLLFLSDRPFSGWGNSFVVNEQITQTK